MLDELGIASDASIVDVGGGASTFVDAVLERGHSDVSVLDISVAALELARQRLGPRGAEITWIGEDLLAWKPGRRFDLWHDRALFHFLVEESDRRRYVDVLRAATGPGGHVVVATFALNGPHRCAGLPVMRYDRPTLGAVLGPEFTLTLSFARQHRTPGGGVQPFTWAAFVRRDPLR